MKTKMYSFDVFAFNKNGKKQKVATHSYPDYNQAQKARSAIERMPYGNYVYQPRENSLYVVRTLGGWTCGKIEEIN